MNDQENFLGIVQNEKCQILTPQEHACKLVRLTKIHMVEPIPPENAEVKLSDYDGSAIMVLGILNGDWIWKAEVIDQAGPILTELVETIFGKA